MVVAVSGDIRIFRQKKNKALVLEVGRHRDRGLDIRGIYLAHVEQLQTWMVGVLLS